MDDLLVEFLIFSPIVVFFSGFLIARQVRPLSNTVLFSKVFIERKLELSLFVGLIFSVVLTLVNWATSGFTLTTIATFLVLFSLTSGAAYLGMRLGLGRLPSGNDPSQSLGSATTQDLADGTFPENVSVENTLAALKITIRHKKRWGFFTIEAIQWLVLSLCAMPIVGLLAIGLLQNYLPQNLQFLVWIAVGGLVLFLIYIKGMEALEYIIDKEEIEVDQFSVRIAKYWSKFSRKNDYPAENIKKITAMFAIGGGKSAPRRSPFLNSNMPVFLIWHNRGLKRYRTVGRSIDPVDAQRILDLIYQKYPQYKG